MKKNKYEAPVAVIYELNVEHQLMLTGSGYANIGDGGTNTNIAAEAKGHYFEDDFDESDE